MSRVIVGVEPHKKLVTMEVIDEQGKNLATGRFGTGTGGLKALLGYVHQQWPDHRWAIEGAYGVGRPLAQRLLADGETVVDVPAKLAARVRVFDTRNARKTDTTEHTRSPWRRCALRTCGCSASTRNWWRSPC